MRNDLPKLTPRLALVASMVREGTKLADIGTDHAYIPVYLVNSHKCKSAVAGDVVEGPLERARKTAALFNAEDKIKFILTDGLHGIEENEADDIVIAGMGGDLISRILEECSWIKDKEKHLVLQPMTAVEDLRHYLSQNGFEIEKESVTSEKNESKLYVVMSVYYTNKADNPDLLYDYVGKLACDNNYETSLYLKRKAESIIKHAEGLEKAKVDNSDEIRHLKTLANDILCISDKSKTATKEEIK